MAKLAGCFLLMMFSLLFGDFASEKYNSVYKRLTRLRDFYDSLLWNISEYKFPVDMAVKQSVKAENLPDNEYEKLLLNGFLTTKDYFEAHKSAEICFNLYPKNIVFQMEKVALILGRETAFKEREILESTIKIIDGERLKKQKIYTEKRSLYVKLSALAGAFTVILIL